MKKIWPSLWRDARDFSKAFFFPVLIGIIPFHMAPVSPVLEGPKGNGNSLDDMPITFQADKNQNPSKAFNRVPDIRPEEQGYIVLRDLDHDSINHTEAPPLPLDGAAELREWAREALPGDSNLDTIRGYTTSHSMPARGIIPSPGLIMVHDADRKEEERVFFGVLSLTIDW